MDDSIRFHIHSDISNANGYYDSSTSFKDYIKLAKQNGHKAIAFSEHGNTYEWIKKKQECDKVGIKYIHGVELYTTPKLEYNIRGYHIGLYAKNWEGVKEINTLMSIASAKGDKKDNSDRHMYYNPRISFEELFNTSNNIIVTTACLQSPINKLYNYEIENITNLLELLLSYQQTNFLTSDFYIKYLNLVLDIFSEEINNYNHYIDFIQWCIKNKHRVFLEIQYHNCEDQKRFNEFLLELSKECEIPLIIGTDTHSSTKYKAECRKVFQKAKSSYYYDGENEFDLTWKTDDEILELFRNQGVIDEKTVKEALSNTLVFSDMVEEFELDYSFKYPTIYGANAKEKWYNYIQSKLQEKINNKEINIDKIDEYNKRIEYEYKVMCKQGMESFMLFMAEMIDWCNNNNIPHGDRGSVGGSMIAYISGITDIDPIRWKTVFSRFCNEHRISLGDIDVDFAPEDREKVYKYIINKFGNNNTSYILTLGTVQTRGAIDVLAKGLDYEDLDIVAEIKNEYDELYNEFSKIIQEEVNLEENDIAIDFENIDKFTKIINNKEKRERAKELAALFDDLKNENKDLFYYFDGVKGTIISKGNHPAGMVGSPITLYDNLGVYYKNGDINQPISSCTMKAVDSLNYVKFDILGLKTLGIIKDVYNYTNRKWEKASLINWEDENVWHNMMLSSVGVFQFEKEYAFSLLKQFEPHKINHMSMINAALRPSGKSYRDQLITKEINKNPSKEIDELLKDNMGYLIFQEDTIKFLTDICGFDGGTADSIRRAIGKKLKDELDKQLPNILEGYCNYSKKPREIAEKEAKKFLQIIQDSSQYQFGFNHSTGYSQNGYRCVRERTYYPVEFITAYLNRAENMDDIENGTQLAKSLGVTINPAKFRHSRGGYTFNKQTKSIYKGLASIKNCNKSCAEELYTLRDNEYYSFTELLIDITENTSVNKRQMIPLIYIDFFDEFGNAAKLLKVYKYFKKRYKKTHKDKTKQVRLDEIRDYERDLQIEDISVSKKIEMEIEYLGYIKTKTNKQNDRNKIYILELSGKKKKRLKGYSIGSGKTSHYRIYYNTLGDNAVGDTIVINKIKSIPRVIRTQNGFEDHPTEKEWLIERIG